LTGGIAVNVIGGKLPDAILSALAGQVLCEGVFAVSPAVAAMVPAFEGGPGSCVPSNALLCEDGEPMLTEADAYLLIET
jgi:hypothetical protein